MPEPRNEEILSKDLEKQIDAPMVAHSNAFAVLGDNEEGEIVACLGDKTVDNEKEGVTREKEDEAPTLPESEETVSIPCSSEMVPETALECQEDGEALKDSEITSPENVQGIPQDAIDSSLAITSGIAQDAQVGGNSPIVDDTPVSIAPIQIRYDEGIELCVDFSGYFKEIGTNDQPVMVPETPEYENNFPPLIANDLIPGQEKLIEEANLVSAIFKARKAKADDAEDKKKTRKDKSQSLDPPSSN